MKVKETIIKTMLLGAVPATSFAQIAQGNMWFAAPVSITPMVFSVNTDISKCPIPEAPILWGMDTAWDSEDNVIRGTNYITKEVMRIGRVSFQPSDLVDDYGNLSSAQQKALQSRLNHIAMSGAKDVIVNCDHEKLNAANYYGKPEEWYKVIKATVMYCRAKGFNVLTVSPFNEPDYTAWGEGTKADFKAICELISKDSHLSDVRISAGNTLNCDQALSWYNYMKPYVTEGNTHQLAGSFNNYATFWQTVRKDGNYATGDELHNVAEAFVGIHYGMQAGVWWAWDGAARGEFCRASFAGKEIAYAENRNAWTAATVYKRENGRVDAFLGSSERQATTSSYDLISADHPVYYDTFGPAYQYVMEMPGGTGYQQGQSNAERLIQISYGEDVPVEQLMAGNSYVIMNVNSGLCLGFSGGATADGTQIVQNKYTGTTSSTHQRWKLEAVSPRIGGDFGYYYLRSERNTKQLIDVRDWSTSAGARLIGFTGGGGTNEQWFFEYAGNGDYYIRSRHSGLYLSIYNASTKIGGSAELQTFTGAANQRWRFMPTNAELELTAPAAPTELKATATHSTVQLSWTKSPSADVDGYMILRGNSDGSQWDVIGRMVGKTEFVDSVLAPGSPYQYKVKAVDRSRNMSEASAAITAQTQNYEGLVARYRFESDIEDDSDNGFAPSAAGTLSYSTLSRKEGSRSLTFSGSTYLQLPPLMTASRNMTIAFWVRYTDNSAWQRVFDFGQGTDTYMFYTPNSGSDMRFVMKKGGEEQIISAAKQATSTWYHVAITLSDTDVRLYVNGTLAETSTAITLRPSDIQSVMNYIGRSQFAADPMFKGGLDDLRIYNCALSSADVARIAAGEEPTDVQLAAESSAASAADASCYDLAGTRVKDSQKGVTVTRGRKYLNK